MHMSHLSLILLFGGNGQLGLALRQLFGEHLFFFPDRGDVDFLLPEQLSNVIDSLQPEVIINAAAYTSVEKAEAEAGLAFCVNAQTVASLAEAAKRVDALLVHISTDYVFDGKGDCAWCEEDQPNPLNIYGLSKWYGEQAIIASGCRHLIFRTSWLHSPWRSNFIKSMLTLGMTKEHLSVVSDQIGAPTSASMLAEAMMHAILVTTRKPELSGLYHVAAQGETSWYDLAKYCFSVAGSMGMAFKVKSIEPISSDDYPSVVLRPLNSRLNTDKFSRCFGMKLPAWQDDVSTTLSSLLRQPEHE